MTHQSVWINWLESSRRLDRRWGEILERNVKDLSDIKGFRTAWWERMLNDPEETRRAVLNNAAASRDPYVGSPIYREWQCQWPW